MRKIGLLSFLAFGLFFVIGCGSSGSKYSDYQVSNLSLFPSSSVFETDNLSWVKTNLPPVDNQYVKFEWFVNGSPVAMSGANGDNAGMNAFIIHPWEYYPGRYELKCKAGNVEANSVFYIAPSLTGQRYVYVYNGNTCIDVWYSSFELMYQGNETSNSEFPAGIVWLDFLSAATGYAYWVDDIRVDLSNSSRISNSYISLTYSDQIGYDFSGTFTSGSTSYGLRSSAPSANFSKEYIKNKLHHNFSDYLEDLKKAGKFEERGNRY